MSGGGGKMATVRSFAFRKEKADSHFMECDKMSRFICNTRKGPGWVATEDKNQNV